MKKIYNSPIIDTIELAHPLMEGGGGIIGSKTDPFTAPKPRPDKPF